MRPRAKGSEHNLMAGAMPPLRRKSRVAFPLPPPHPPTHTCTLTCPKKRCRQAFSTVTAEVRLARCKQVVTPTRHAPGKGHRLWATASRVVASRPGLFPAASEAL